MYGPQAYEKNSGKTKSTNKYSKLRTVSREDENIIMLSS